MSFLMRAEGGRAAPAVHARERLRGTPQQEAFWAELEGGSDHVLLEARAGTGKSTSCREGMHRLLGRNPSLAIRYCCFNKKIADEFAERCPSGVEVGTMHRFGLAALAASLGSKIDKNKTYTLLDGTGHGPNLRRYVRKSISTLVGLAKNHGYGPDEPELKAKLDELVWRYDVPTWKQQGELVEWAAEMLARSAETTALCDFDDMLWLPVLHGVDFPKVDFLFIDECQDLNPVQHALAERLCDSGRIVVVGDPYQSIYAFRGADSDSIPKLRAKLDARVMPLTVTFRCPRSHVELARQLVGDFEAAPEAPEGTLVEDGPEAVDEARPGDLVLCRTNAPIVRACLQAIGRREPAIVRGRAIGEQLQGVLRGLGDAATVPELGRAIDVWRAGEVARFEARDGTDDLIEQVNDKADCLLAVAGSCATPAEVPGVLDALFSDDDAGRRVTFSSVHRAKGSEARRVAYIQVPFSERRDRLRPPQPWELQQRRNLRYVTLTRSLDTLTLIDPAITRTAGA